MALVHAQMLSLLQERPIAFYADSKVYFGTSGNDSNGNRCERLFDRFRFGFFSGATGSQTLRGCPHEPQLLAWDSACLMDATGRSNTCCTGCWIICWETAGKRAKAPDRGKIIWRNSKCSRGFGTARKKLKGARQGRFGDERGAILDEKSVSGLNCLS